MRLLPSTLAALAFFSHLGVISCHDHDDDHDFVQDVAVDITGDAGTPFEAFFEDHDRAQTATGVVPFGADFEDQIDFFRAIVDKDSGGSEEICVTLTTSHDSRESCTTSPNGRVSVTIVF